MSCGLGLLLLQYCNAEGGKDQLLYLLNQYLHETCHKNNITGGWCLWLRRSGPGRTRSLAKDAVCKKRWTHTGYSLCVAGGPRQPLGLLQYEDRSRNVIRRALNLVRRQSQELRSAVGESQRQIRAAGMVPVGAAGHHTSHEIGHRRLHPREHGPAAARLRPMRSRELPRARQIPARTRSFAAWKTDTQRPRRLIQRRSTSVNAEMKATQARSAARWSCDKPAAAGGFGLAGVSVSGLVLTQCWRSKVRNPRGGGRAAPGQGAPLSSTD